MAKKKKTEENPQVDVTKIFLGTINIGDSTFQIFDDVETSARELIEEEK